MWKPIVVILLIIIIGIGIYYSLLPRGYITECSYYYNEMSKSDNIDQLKDYINNTLNDPIDGFGYAQLIIWEHIHLIYTSMDIIRTNMAINILQSGLGRCGEFSLLYVGLCLANGIPVRLIIDDSVLINRSKSAAGDHMWCEVTDKHIPIEITQSLEGSDGLIINQSHYYRDVWNKDINKVTAIWIDHGTMMTEDVTSTYS